VLAPGRRLVGVDSQPAVVERAAPRCPALEAAVADVRSLPFADRELDAVVSSSTLGSTPTPRSNARCASSGGCCGRAALPENRAVVRAYRNAGWRRVGTVGHVRIGPWRRDFVRRS
jgi:Methyltransferase domain